MGKVRERMTADLELRNLSRATKESYLKRVRAFIAFFNRPAERLGEKEVREYLLDRKQKVKPATLGVDIAALRFLYEVTLQRPNEVASIPWPKIPRASLPDILSGCEVIQVLASIESFKHRTILTPRAIQTH
jgi:site-specific recombinase XerD